MVHFSVVWILTSTVLLYEHREQGLKFGVSLDLIKEGGHSLERPEKEDKTGDGKAEIKQVRLYVGSPLWICAFPFLKRAGENLPSHPINILGTRWGKALRKAGCHVGTGCSSVFSSLEKCYWKARWKEKVSVYTKELKREIGILEITQCNGKILETRLDFVLTLGLVFFFLWCLQ